MVLSNFLGLLNFIKFHFKNISISEIPLLTHQFSKIFETCFINNFKQRTYDGIHSTSYAHSQGFGASPTEI